MNGAVAWMALLSSGQPGRGLPRAAAADPGSPADVVVVGVSPARAESIAATASAVRHEIESLLFDTSARRAWTPACVIHVHPDRQAFARAVGGPAVAAGGATSIEFVGDQVSLRRIDVVDAADGGLPAAIPHELVHVVLADRFTAAPPPRWVDEGLATLFDDPAKQAGHDADFRRAAAQGQAWRLDDLVRLDLDPADAVRQRVFYGQSAALVRWLLARADGPTLLGFVDATTDHGPDAAARTHYGFATTAALEAAWRAGSEPVGAGVPRPAATPVSTRAGRP